ncbi:MAG: class I SAM-dependent methyltransferase [Alphaproteobacteria bacterium]
MVKLLDSTQPAEGTTLDALNKLSELKRDLSSEWALDLGCGAGRDTFEILKKMKVVAVDQQKEGLELIKNHMEKAHHILGERLRLVEESFEQMAESASFWEPEKYLFINASFSLPFCSPKNFERLWQNIKKSLRSQGIFAGQFFALNHGWASQKQKSFFSKKNILEKLKGFQVTIKEEEKDSEAASGEMVHWHIFHVVAQKD